MFVLVFTPIAENDATEAALWYERQRRGLGADFLLILEAELSSIIRAPFLSQEQRFGYRRREMKRFPYGIIYRIDNEKIVVVAVWHFSRRPWKWKRRK